MGLQILAPQDSVESRGPTEKVPCFASWGSRSGRATSSRILRFLQKNSRSVCSQDPGASVAPRKLDEPFPGTRRRRFAALSRSDTCNFLERMRLGRRRFSSNPSNRDLRSA